MGRSRLIVVIPAHNEEATIGAVVRGAAAHAEVVVVDDCSTDGTAAAARAAGAHVVSNAVNLRYDGSIAAGFAEAERLGADAVVTMDADGEHAPERVAEFRRLLLDENVPLVLGVRPRKQRLAEVVVGWYVRLRYGVKDVLCGMKGFHMALYRENDGFDHVGGVNTELALNAIRRGHAFRQIPVWGTPRADAPRFGRALRANWQILRALGRVLALDVARP